MYIYYLILFIALSKVITMLLRVYICCVVFVYTLVSPVTEAIYFKISMLASFRDLKVVLCYSCFYRNVTIPSVVLFTFFKCVFCVPEYGL